MYHLQSVSLILVILFLLLSGISWAAKVCPLKEFEAAEAPLQNVLYVSLPEHGRVVVLAGRNALYKLSAENLSLQASWRTGPEYDSILCPPYPLYCDQKRQATDNDNQILLQIGRDPLVLACGTTSQGMCSIYQLLLDFKPLKQMDKSLLENYVASSASTTAFFGSIGKNDIMFVASLYDGRPFKYHPYVVSARSVNTTGSFKVRSSIPTIAFFQNVTESLSEVYIISYVYGFSHNGFAYFLTVQKRGTFSSTMETRLVRVWEKEPFLLTYMDLPIRCAENESGRRKIATVAISASLEQLPTEAKFRSKVLAIAFGTPGSERWDLIDTSLGSQLCFFDMDRVEAAFYEAIETKDEHLPKEDLSDFSHCHHLKCGSTGKRSDVCSTDLKYFREDQVSLTGKATMNFKEGLVTSVTVMRQNGSTVSWVSDNEGFLHKVLLQGQRSKLLFWTDLSNRKGIPIEKSTALDSRRAYGYFLLGPKVVKYPVGSCRMYTTCSKCLKSHDDPLQCGWCENRCAHRAECPPDTELVFDRCPVEVHAVSPMHGPTSGGTVLNIFGDNFGYWWREPSNSIHVSVNGKECKVIVWISSLVKCKTPPNEHAARGDIVISVNDTVRDAKKNYDVIDTLTLPHHFVYERPATEDTLDNWNFLVAVVVAIQALVVIGSVAAVRMVRTTNEHSRKIRYTSGHPGSEKTALGEEKRGERMPWLKCKEREIISKETREEAMFSEFMLNMERDCKKLQRKLESLKRKLREVSEQIKHI